MNDWLNYKGSGSARAYSANGLMSDSNISHALRFTTPAETRKKEQEEKQRMAELRLYNSKAEKLTSDITKLDDDISKHHMNIFFEISRKQSAADNALTQLNAAKKSGNANKIAALESKARTIVNDVNRDITEWNNAKDSLIQKVLIYDSRVTNLINERPNNNYTETLYTSQAVEGLQNARNKLFYDRDLLKDTVIYKITM